MSRSYLTAICKEQLFDDIYNNELSGMLIFVPSDMTAIENCDVNKSIKYNNINAVITYVDGTVSLNTHTQMKDSCSLMSFNHQTLDIIFVKDISYILFRNIDNIRFTYLFDEEPLHSLKIIPKY